jgi:hypothetical protein
LGSCVYRPFGTGLVHLFDHLKRQDDVADFVGLAVPNQLDLSLVFKQQEAVFVWQGFSLF